MIETVNKSQFIDTFRDMDRENQFSYNGKIALYDYLTESEEEQGEPIELDIIALCCEYTEYEDIWEFLKEHDSYYTIFKDFKEENKDIYDNEEEFKEEYKEQIFKEINDNTALIKIDDDSFIISDY